MKSVSTLCIVTLMALTSFAQNNASQTNARLARESTTKSKGMTVGFIYSNLSESKFKATTKIVSSSGDTETISIDSNGGTSAGLYGLDVGYKNNYAWGPLGFNTALAVLKGLNKSELPASLTFIKLQGNVVYPIQDIWSISSGMNITDITGQDPSLTHLKYQPWIGGQFGVQADIGPVGILLGYQTIGVKVTGNGKESGATFDVDGEGYTSGIISQVSYTF